MVRISTENKNRNLKCSKSVKTNVSKKNEKINIIKLFQYSDNVDKLLICIGILSASVAAGLFPFIFYLYGQMSGTLVDYQKLKNLNHSFTNVSQELNFTEKSICFRKLPKNINQFNQTIFDGVKLYLIFGLVTLILNYLANFCLSLSSERQINRIRSKLFCSIIKEDLKFFKNYSNAELNSYIKNNIDTFKLGIGFKFADFIHIFGRGVTCLILALIAAWRFSVVFLGLSIFSFMISLFLLKKLKKCIITESSESNGANKHAQEILGSIRTVISLGLQFKAVQTYERILKSCEKIAKRKGLLYGMLTGSAMSSFNFIFGVSIFYATYLERTDCVKYSAKNLMQSFFALVTATFSIVQSLAFLKDLTQAKIAAKKIFEIINETSILNDDKKKLKILDLQGDISFEKVNFSYLKNSPKILDDFSLQISPGKTVAICGSSGSGKSTLISLIQSLHKPISGKIKIDGEDISHLESEWLRESISVVSQEPTLFATTIRENIRLGKLNASDSEIEEASKMANAHEFIMNSSDKYETQVGENGIQLSGGQKQRIAIARALLRNPKILLLDESTSALDNQSEKLIQIGLNKSKTSTRTTIIIAHRLNTIKSADMIVTIANGRVKEKGTHEELMALKGEYFKLIELQTKINDDDILKENKNNISQTLEDNCSISSSESLSCKSKSSSLKSCKEQTKEKSSKRKKCLHYERKLLRYQKNDALWIIFGCVSQMAYGAIFPCVAFLFSEIYTIFSMVDKSAQKRVSIIYMVIIFILGLLNFFFIAAWNYSFTLCGIRITKAIRFAMFKSMLRQEISFHDMEQNRSSVLSTQLAVIAPRCKGLTTDLMGIYCQGFGGILFPLVVSFVISWKLSVIMLLFIPIIVISGIIISKTANSEEKNGKSSLIEGSKLANDAFRNMPVVKSFVLEEYFIKKFNNIFLNDFKRSLLSIHLKAICYGLAYSAIFFIQAVTFGYGYYLIRYHQLDVTDLFRVYSSITFSSLLLGSVYSDIPDHKQARKATKTAFKIIERESKIDSMSDSGIVLEKLTGNIEFKNVYFNYNSRPNVFVLKNFNLSIKNGVANALVGRSGCGKSTVISLLLRFYDVTSGEIMIEGCDIKRLNVQWLRSRFGLVSQEPTLFNSTIKENILNGDINRKNILMKEITNYAIQANIDDRIQHLPDKYDTIVGSQGNQLSGGEKQRIAIARLLIKDPKILLLDEATSALDSKSELNIQNTLEKVCEGRTSIIIAHRLNTIVKANIINVLDNGCLHEHGSHLELIQKRSLYYKMNQ